MRPVRRPILVAAAAIVAASASVGVASNWDFNVFSGSTIGAPGKGYGSSFAGAAGAVGDAHFINMGLRTEAGASPSLPKGFYGGGDFVLSGGVHGGGVAVHGDVHVNSASIVGEVSAGGDLKGSGGSITGDVELGGQKIAGNQVSVTGAIKAGVEHVAPVDLKGVKAYFEAFSASVREKAPNGSYTNQWGNLLINATESVTIVDMSKSDFQSAWGISISGGGIVVVNVIGDGLNFGSKTWNYSGGAAAGTTLVNFADATSITMSGSHTANILAPKASVAFSSGTITGHLIVGALNGSGSVAWNGGFQGYETLSGTKKQGVRVVRWREVAVGE